jgi:hypothetical protein
VYPILLYDAGSFSAHAKANVTRIVRTFTRENYLWDEQLIDIIDYNMQTHI